MIVTVTESSELTLTPTEHQLQLMRRRQRAWQMRQQGVTFREIGLTLGIATETAWRDIRRVERQRKSA